MSYRIIDDWRTQAACSGAAQPGIDSPWDEGASRADVAYALDVCWNQCPVQSECAADAWRHKPAGGVWAGVQIKTRTVAS